MGESLPVSICVPGCQVGVANVKWEEPLDGVQLHVTNDSPWRRCGRGRERGWSLSPEALAEEERAARNAGREEKHQANVLE